MVLQYRTSTRTLNSCLFFRLIDELKKRRRRRRLFHSQAVQVRPALHPSHLSPGSPVVQGRRPQTGFLGAPAVRGGLEDLEAPDGTR